MLRLRRSHWLSIVAHALDGLPEEVCGLLAGQRATRTVEELYRCANAAASARVYTLDPLDHLRADRDAEGRGMEILGVYHSHTHTPAYPSPTDVAQAPDPSWRYVIVSLQHAEPVLRSFEIAGGEVIEHPIVMDDR